MRLDQILRSVARGDGLTEFGVDRVAKAFDERPIIVGACLEPRNVREGIDERFLALAFVATMPRSMKVNVPPKENSL